MANEEFQKKNHLSQRALSQPGPYPQKHIHFKQVKESMQQLKGPLQQAVPFGIDSMSICRPGREIHNDHFQKLSTIIRILSLLKKHQKTIPYTNIKNSQNQKQKIERKSLLLPEWRETVLLNAQCLIHRDKSCNIMKKITQRRGNSLAAVGSKKEISKQICLGYGQARHITRQHLGLRKGAWSSNVFPTTLFNRNLTRGRYGCFLVNFYNMAVFFLLFPFILHSFCYYILKNILFSQCCFSCLTLLLAFFIVMFFLTNPPCEDPPKSLSLLWPKSKFNSSPCSCSPTDPSLHSQVCVELFPCLMVPAMDV